MREKKRQKIEEEVMFLKNAMLGLAFVKDACLDIKEYEKLLNRFEECINYALGDEKSTAHSCKAWLQEARSVYEAANKCFSRQTIA